MWVRVSVPVPPVDALSVTLLPRRMPAFFLRFRSKCVCVCTCVCHNVLPERQTDRRTDRQTDRQTDTERGCVMYVYERVGVVCDGQTDRQRVCVLCMCVKEWVGVV